MGKLPEGILTRRLWVLLRCVAVLACAPAAVWPQFSPGPLSRAHHALDGPTHCTSCHVAGGGDRKFRCLSCHTEIRERLAGNRGLHPSLVARGRPDDQCARCHSEHNGENFVPTRWDVSLDEFDHRKTGYPLEGAHAGLKCDRCHQPERIPAAARHDIRMKDLRRTYLGLTSQCVGCHQDEHRGQLGNACERCHEISRWKDVARFDHSTARFRLSGAHVRVPCQKCHAAVPAPGEEKARVRYTGMAFAQCASCHQDPHRGAFSAPCGACHNDIAWKPAHNTTVTFDHSRTKFPLAGKHAPVTCDKCHRTTDFKAPVAHERCDSCHQDIHGGQFISRAGRGECGACHTADGWKPATFTVAAHAQSAYPLTGRHAAVACAGCHTPAGAATLYHVRYQTCTDCHRDAHEGQFVNTANENRCEGCHTVKGWRPASFTLARHNQTRFPLQDAHAAVSCADCHRGSTDRPQTVQYRFADLTCAGCHRDPHQGQFQQRMTATEHGAPAGCLACHNLQAWDDVSRFDHSTTRFLLTGAHRGVPCDKCHRVTPLSTGLRKAVFHDTPMACGGCHEDVHNGQFVTASQKSDCADCHNNNKWREAKFDHNRTGFPLAGAHVQVPCRDCHKNLHGVSGRMVLFYKPAPTECSGCHGTRI